MSTRAKYVPLSGDELKTAVSGLVEQGWQLKAGEKEIEKEYKFKGFPSAWVSRFLDIKYHCNKAFLTQVAMYSHRENHHPEIWNVYDQVKLTLTTHDMDGLTTNDVDMAKQFEKLSAKYE